MSRSTRSRRQKPSKTPVKFWMILGTGVVMVLIAGFFALRGSSSDGKPAIDGTPQLQADQQTIDLGDVRLGQTVSASFELQNDGDGTLRFQEAPYVEVVEGC